MFNSFSIFFNVKIKLPNSIINLNFHSKMIKTFFKFCFQASIKRFIRGIFYKSRSLFQIGGGDCFIYFAGKLFFYVTLQNTSSGYLTGNEAFSGAGTGISAVYLPRESHLQVRHATRKSIAVIVSFQYLTYQEIGILLTFY